MDPFNNNIRVRSPWLVVLAVLTFINSGFSFLHYFVQSISSQLMPSIIEMYEKMEGIPDETIEMLKAMADVPSWQFFVLSLGFVLAIVGAAMMLKVNKVGFHLYVIAQIWQFVMFNLVIKGVLAMDVISIIITVMVIFFYWFLLKDALANKEWLENNTNYEEVKDEEEDDDDE